MFDDLRFGWRILRKDPGVTAAACLSLAVGIGASTAMFSVIDAVLLEPFPYREAGRIAGFDIESVKSGQSRGQHRMGEYLEIRDQNRVFEDAIANTWEDLTLTGGREPELLRGIAVSGNTFEFLGVAPLIGRGILPSDTPAGAAASVAVLDYKTWRRRFGADSGVLGRSLQLNGQRYTIVGVMPSRFGWRGADVWIPLAIDRANPRMVSVRGRLKSGVTFSLASEELRAIHERLAVDHPRDYPRDGFSIHVYSLTDGVIGQFRTTLYILFGAVTLLLLIACGNVANLQLVKATQRSREMAIRAAMGAGPWRLVRQLLTESLVLAGAGSAMGVAIEIWGTHLLVRLMPPFGIPNEARIAVNGRVLMFSAALALATGVVFGLAPALAAARPDLNQGLKEGGRGAGDGRRGSLARSALVIIEMALALVLLVGAGLMLRSFAAYRETDLGFRPENILTLRIPLSAARYTRPDQRTTFYRDLLERLRTVEGIQGATVSLGLPPRAGGNSAFEIEGRSGPEQAQCAVQAVSRDYFRTLRITLLRGRLFETQEEERAEPVALISEFMSRHFFAGEDPLGRRLRLQLRDRMAPREAARDPWVRIVGVVATVKNSGVQNDPRPSVYLPYSALPAPNRILAVRTAYNPLAVAGAVRAQIAAIDKDQVVSDISTVEQELKDDESRPRFSTAITTVFALTGLLLAGVGAYSVVSYTFSLRAREIGLRMALGARESHIVWMVLSSGLQLALGGALIGALGAWSFTRFIAHLLYKVSPADPLTFGVAWGALICSALSACYIPARRAARTDPQCVLRCD